MTVGIVDTTVIFHLFRKNPAALAGYSALTVKLSATPITWMEALYGAASPSGSVKALRSMIVCNYTPLTQSEAAIPLHKRSGGARDFLLRFSPSPKAKRLGEGVGG